MKGVNLAIVLMFIGVAIYWAGGRDDRATRELIDKKGAENVRETTQGTLDGIADDADPIGLLNDTNGLRD